MNEKGIQWYSNFIDELLKNGIEPFVVRFRPSDCSAWSSIHLQFCLDSLPLGSAPGSVRPLWRLDEQGGDRTRLRSLRKGGPSLLLRHIARRADVPCRDRSASRLSATASHTGQYAFLVVAPGEASEVSHQALPALPTLAPPAVRAAQAARGPSHAICPTLLACPFPRATAWGACGAAPCGPLHLSSRQARSPWLYTLG